MERYGRNLRSGINEMRQPMLRTRHATPPGTPSGGTASTTYLRILAWAAENDRILLTHDEDTIPGFAYERVGAGEMMPGVFVANRMTVGEIIDELLMIDTASEQHDWANQVLFLPLR